MMVLGRTPKRRLTLRCELPEAKPRRTDDSPVHAIGVDTVLIILIFGVTTETSANCVAIEAGWGQRG